MAIQGRGKPVIKKVIKTLQKWAPLNGMKLNLKKCGIMLHKGTMKLNKEEKLTNSFMGIPLTEEYKYLGI